MGVGSRDVDSDIVEWNDSSSWVVSTPGGGGPSAGGPLLVIWKMPYPAAINEIAMNAQMSILDVLIFIGDSHSVDVTTSPYIKGE